MTPLPQVRTPPVALGVAGLLPSLAGVVLALVEPATRSVAAIVGGAYAALILSFLGGMWWMQALLRSDARWWPYLLAVAPSLTGWAALLAVVGGVAPPAAALTVLALALLASPLGDRAIGPLLREVPAWRQLRLTLSGGLGALTLALALIAGRG
ncbi:hypothetical protein GCM10022253_13210 [Sphingomonas endophytica]|uniref:DUF3429 domain-containing protein n=1 Tax=Sphingomonas endophytica TaxID=869719 RepID=A0ABR6N538_9SPHN|nr:DUF3429 domain-containing protein [Sphingomonas endophytica]MBB5725909.1 hypothetical protein [Sphingomonas endophytica]